MTNQDVERRRMITQESIDESMRKASHLMAGHEVRLIVKMPIRRHDKWYDAISKEYWQIVSVVEVNGRMRLVLEEAE